MKLLTGITVPMNVLLLITFFSLGIAQRSGGDEGIWAVMLFYPLIMAAPVASIIVIVLQLRRQRQGRGPEWDPSGSPRSAFAFDTAMAAP